MNVTINPKVGDKVAVMHASRVNSEGHPSGKLQETKVHYDEIVQVYLDGDVKVKSGDVWSVVPATDGKARWKTVKGK